MFRSGRIFFISRCNPNLLKNLHYDQKNDSYPSTLENDSYLSTLENAKVCTLAGELHGPPTL